MGTLGEVWLLRPDGSLWKVDTEWGTEFQPLPEAQRTIAIAFGVKRYPWLDALLPIRPIDAVACPRCEGAGDLTQSVPCFSCDGLGWCRPEHQART